MDDDLYNIFNLSFGS